MVEKNSPRYIDVLPKIVESYNRTWHSGIRSEPINVNKTNEKQLWWQMYWPKEPYDPNKKKHEIKYAFKIGDRVRTPFLRRPFQREYDTRWTGEIFKITRRFMRQGQPIYKLADWYNKPVKGTFYQKELQKIEVTDDDMFKVEKVIKYKGRGNKREALVRWLGWPKQFDSWVPISQLNKKYLCGIVELAGKVVNLKGDLFLCCDFCEESVVGHIKLPVLRCIKRKQTGIVYNDINHVIWLQVIRPNINSIRLYIANEKGEINTVEKSKLKCTLVLTPPKNEC